MQYEIRIEGVLDERWSCWFDGLQITPEREGVSAITGRAADQAALHGLLARLRDPGIPRISVRRLDRRRVGRSDAPRRSAEIDVETDSPNWWMG